MHRETTHVQSEKGNSTTCICFDMVKIGHISHTFSTVQGIRQTYVDMLYLILNEMRTTQNNCDFVYYTMYNVQKQNDNI